MHAIRSPSAAVLAWIAGLVIAASGSLSRAHDPRFDPPDPLSVSEAWDVIRQCSRNIGSLVETGQLDEVPYQVGNCSPAIRLLQAHAAEQPDSDTLAQNLTALFAIGGDVINATRERSDPIGKSRRAFAKFQETVAVAAAHFKSEVVEAGVYICPMHPLDRHLEASARCTQCGMALVRRRIAASSVYEKPGEPSMKIKVIPDHPLSVGREAHLRLTINRNNGQPVTPDDLLIVHTQKIHLLIVDRSLDDYHHEHPKPLSTPGEYEFAFTPLRSGPYRVWADVVPGSSSMQEYLIADIPADGAGNAIGDQTTSLHSDTAGLTFELSFYPAGEDLRVGKVATGRINVFGPDRKPYGRLEPVMGAFAHVVGFNEDYKTVVHIHPMGNEPREASDRGGPTLQFMFYPPVAGFMRLYCQVSIEGKMTFVPFSVTVLPAR